jgi:DNA polymerase IV
MKDRVIMHCDMNAFFAAVEQQSNPQLRGKPVGIIGASHRTIITTASYEARRYGVRTGMAKWEALQCCPDLVLVVGNNRKYTYTSARIFEMMREYTPLVEVFSIDEAFLDVTGSRVLFGSAQNIAYHIKARIRHHFGLTCSIGIAPNKLLAKLASEMHKPDGLTIIRPDQVADIMARTPIDDLCGIGRWTKRKLQQLGIETCGQLGRYPQDILRRKFGIIGDRLHRMGLGIDESAVIPEEKAEPVKTVGHSMTLPRDISRREEIHRYLLQLSEMVGRRARRYGVSGRTVHLTIRYADFDTNIGKQSTLTSWIDRSDEIYRAVLGILDGIELAQPIRLLGVRLSNLRHQQRQLPLLREERRKALATYAMDEVNNQYGDFKVTFGSLLNDEQKGSSVISPAWKPTGIRNVNVG